MTNDTWSFGRLEVHFGGASPALLDQNKNIILKAILEIEKNDNGTYEDHGIFYFYEADNQYCAVCGEKEMDEDDNLEEVDGAIKKVCATCYYENTFPFKHVWYKE